MAAFQRAVKRNMRLRCALEGPPGSGKTYTALSIGRALVGDAGRIAVIDTERGSASKYSDEFDFDVVELDTFAPATFVEMIREAERAGYDLLIIDSLSHAWMGTDGMLDQVDKIAKRKQLSSTFAAWKDANPLERELWDTMLACGMHVIATLRTKTEYVVDEVVGRDGKKRVVPKKVGLAPIQREGLEYEFDVVADIDMDHNMVISKTRCKALTDGIFPRAGADVAGILREWLGHDAAPAAEAEAAPEPEPEQPKGNGKPKSADRAAYKIQIAEANEILQLPNDVRSHIWNQRSALKGKKPESAPLDDLRTFAHHLGLLARHVSDGRVSRELALDWLHDTPEGTDSLTAALTRAAEAQAEVANG
jgi:hypothetical protein